MAKLKTNPNLTHHDDIYEKLIDLHAGCSDDESDKRNAKLILILANHIGDSDIVIEAIELVKNASDNTSPA